MNIDWKKILNFFVTLAIPIILSTLSILLLLSPLFINQEYQRPGFPEDGYGFSTEERLEYGNKTRRYLVTRQTLDVLRELEFKNGDDLYQERELVHLEDVKVVIQGLLRVFYGAIAVLIGGGIVSSRDQRQNEFWLAIIRGGRLTAILLLTILFFTLISFRALFTSFHLIFFDGDSWLFNYSDTLIRLFPIRFWQDAFLVFGLVTLAGSGVLGWGIPALRRILAKRSGSQS